MYHVCLCVFEVQLSEQKKCCRPESRNCPRCPKMGGEDVQAAPTSWVMGVIVPTAKSVLDRCSNRRFILANFYHKFITLSVHLCLQHVFRDAARRAGSSATADICLQQNRSFICTTFFGKLILRKIVKIVATKCHIL